MFWVGIVATLSTEWGDPRKVALGVACFITQVSYVKEYFKVSMERRIQLSGVKRSICTITERRP